MLKSLVVALVATLSAALVTPQAVAATDVGVTDPNLHYVGRWHADGSLRVPNWAGAYVQTSFTGTTVQVKLRDAVNIYVSIDGGADVFHQAVRGTVNLTPTPLAAGTHRLRIAFRSGDTVFGGLVLDSGARTVNPNVSPKVLEFVGDSITRRWGATDYPELLAHWKQSFFGWNAADFGWGADRTENILWRLENGELDDVHPKVIVLLAGTNNIGTAPPTGPDDARIASVTAGVEAIVETMQRKAPNATIIAGSARATSLSTARSVLRSSSSALFSRKSARRPASSPSDTSCGKTAGKRARSPIAAFNELPSRTRVRMRSVSPRATGSAMQSRASPSAASKGAPPARSTRGTSSGTTPPIAIHGRPPDTRARRAKPSGPSASPASALVAVTRQGPIPQ